MELTFGQNLALVRDSLGLTQSEVAERSGIAQGRISDWEKGKGRPYWDQVRDLAAAMGISADVILKRADDAIPTFPSGDLEREVWKVIRTIGADNAFKLLTGRIWKVVEVREGTIKASEEGVRPADQGVPSE